MYKEKEKMKNIFEQCYTHIKEYEDIKQGIPFTKEQDETIAELLKDKELVKKLCPIKSEFKVMLKND